MEHTGGIFWRNKVSWVHQTLHQTSKQCWLHSPHWKWKVSNFSWVLGSASELTQSSQLWMQLIQILSVCMYCSQLQYKLYFICLYQKSSSANIKGWVINIGWWVKLLSNSFIFNNFLKLSVTSHYIYNCATILHSCLVQVIYQALFNK